MQYSKLALFFSHPAEQMDKDLLGANPQNNTGVCGQEQDPTLSVSVRVDPFSTFYRTELNFSWQAKHRYLIVVYEGRQPVFIGEKAL